MAPRVYRHPRTIEILVREYEFLAVESPRASEATAEKFLVAVERTLEAIAGTPRIGRRWTRSPVVKELRYFPVRDFENWLIFYAEIPDGIVFLTVIHGARDLPRSMEDLDGQDE